MSNDNHGDLPEACRQELGDLRGRLTLSRARGIAQETGLALHEVERLALEQGVVPARYERNIGTLGVEGQRRLLGSCVALVGLGGLGGHVLESLARLGVGRIVGIDGDTIAESNLNRQVLARADNLGCRKAQEAGRRVGLINPAVQFAGYPMPFEQLGDDILCECPVVFDCLDSVAARRVLAGRCGQAGVTMIHGAIAGWSGQVAVCRPGSRILDKLYAGDKHGIEERLGNLPFTAAVAAHIMVSLGVRLLLGEAPAERDRVLLFDLLGQEWQSVEL